MFGGTRIRRIEPAENRSAYACCADQPYRSVPQCEHCTNIPAILFVLAETITLPEHSVHASAKRGATLRLFSPKSLSWITRISSGKFCLSRIRNSSSSGDLSLQSSSRLFKSRSTRTKSIGLRVTFDNVLTHQFAAAQLSCSYLLILCRAAPLRPLPTSRSPNASVRLNLFPPFTNSLLRSIGEIFFSEINECATVDTKI